MRKNSGINTNEIIEIAREAGSIAIAFYQKEYSIREKENKTPVTEADVAIHNFLMDALSVYSYPILSEEDSHEYGERAHADYVWIIDPLDGTADFIQKTGEFSIMIGLIDKNGKSILGVVYAPASNELYYAKKDVGAFLIKDNESKDLTVSGEEIEHGRILVSRNHLGQWEQDIAEKYHMTQLPMGSAGLKICRIAAGGAELYINSSNKSGLWDICAADIILSEVGGFICDTKKEKIMYNVEDVLLQQGYIAIHDHNLISKIEK